MSPPPVWERYATNYDVVGFIGWYLDRYGSGDSYNDDITRVLEKPYNYEEVFVEYELTLRVDAAPLDELVAIAASLGIEADVESWLDDDFPDNTDDLAVEILEALPGGALMAYDFVR